MSRRAEFEEANPDFPLLAATQAGRVDLVMGAVGWLGDEEQVTGCRTLASDSSTVMRVELQELRGGWRTAVLKQSLPWLRRDESVAMPADRARAELGFYRQVARLPEAAAHMPRLLGGDERRSLLLLEDFRDSSDLTSLYGGRALSEEAAAALGAFLRALHENTDGGGDRESSNPGMKGLNHRLLFEAPFGSGSSGDGGFGPDGPALGRAALDELEEGLGASATAMRSDAEFRNAVAELGRRYLDTGACLVHGAFHPGNWLLLPDGGVRIVDPQYGGWGDAEFDVGTGLAHLLLARQPEETVRIYLAAAADRSGGGREPDDSDLGEPAPEAAVETSAARRAASTAAGAGQPGLDAGLTARYAGVELARRLIGGGRVPLTGDAGVRTALLATARTAVVEGRLEVLET